MAKYIYCLFILLFFNNNILAQEVFKPPCDISCDLAKAQLVLNESIIAAKECLATKTTLTDCKNLDDLQFPVVKSMASLDYPKDSKCYDTAMEWRLDHDIEIDTFLETMITYDDLLTRLLEREDKLKFIK